MKPTKVLLIFSLLSLLIMCQNCRNGQFIFGDTCFDSCPPNTVIVKRPGPNRCEECDITKLLILSADQTKCQCALQTYYIQQQDACAPCHYTCLTCTGPSQKQCDKCEAPNAKTFRKKVGRSCPCIPGYVDIPSLQAIKCTRCHPDCQTCSGPLETECLSCANGKIKNQLQQCVCANSFVQNEFGMCSCPFPLTVLPDGLCKDALTFCGFNEESVFTKIKDFAAAPSVDFLNKQCACRPGLFRVKNQCRACKPNQIYHAKQRKCECDPKGFKEDDKCIICPADQTYNKRVRQCQCKKGSQKSQNGTCVTCPNKAFYREGGVGCDCVFNYYPEKGKCKKCTKNSEHPNCQQNPHNNDKPRRLELNELVNNLNIPDPGLRSFQILNPVIAN